MILKYGELGLINIEWIKSEEEEFIPFWPSLVSWQESWYFVDSDSSFPKVVSDFLSKWNSFDALGLPGIKFLLSGEELIEFSFEGLEVLFESFWGGVVFAAVVDTSWNNVFVINLNDGIEFSGDTIDVTVDHDLRSSIGLFLFKSSDFNENFWGFGEVG